MEYSLIEVCQIRSWKHFCCAETFSNKWEIPNKYCNMKEWNELMNKQKDKGAESQHS